MQVGVRGGLCLGKDGDEATARQQAEATYGFYTGTAPTQG